MKANRFLKISLFAGVATLLAFAIYFWDFGYSSDRALIGLIAKKILQYGEHPIFIYKAGYQGILLEGHLVAFLFKLFGVSPRILDLASELLFLPLVFFFYLSVRAFYDETIALLASILLVVGSPDVHFNLLRTQPNYTETFLYGFVLFWAYSQLLRRKHLLLNSALIGFFSGWGLYTYQQIGYFILALGIHATLLILWSLRKNGFFSNVSELFSFLLLPSRKFSGWIKIPGIALLFIGLISFWTGGDFHFGSHSLKWDPATMIRDSSLILFFIAFVRWLSYSWRKISGLSYICVLVAAVSSFVGYFPALYYKYALKLPAPGQSGMDGDWFSVSFRFHVFLHAMTTFLNISIFPDGPFYPWRIIVAVIAFAAVLFFIWISLKQIHGFIFHANSIEEATSVSPYFLLLFVIPLVFSVSNMIINIYRARYAEPVVASLAVALAFFFVEVFRKTQGKRLFRVAVVLSTLLIVANNAFALGRVFLSHEKHPFSEIVNCLDAEKINRAYGSYWLAYSVTFLTDERILIEPNVNNWIPHYAAMVAAEERIAFVDNEATFPNNQSVITLYGQNYRVEKKDVLDDHVTISILRKMK